MFQFNPSHHRITPLNLLGLLGLLGIAVYGLTSLSLSGQPVPDHKPQTAQQMVQASQGNAPIMDGDLIRVGISDNSQTALEYPTAHVSAKGPYQLWDKGDKNSKKPLFQGQLGQTVAISVSKAGFQLSVAGKPLTKAPVTGPILVKPINPETHLVLPGVLRRKQAVGYHGQFEIVRGYSSPAKLTVVNILPLQEYLKAVVPNELPPHYGPEAVRAQAIAARNYALRPRVKPWPSFDICDSQECQVYFGSSTETPQSNRALEETEGLVALHKGEIALTLYSSSHGGAGEAYQNAFSDPKTGQFPAPPIPYLAGGPDIPLPKNWDLSTEKDARAFWTSRDIQSYDVKSSLYRWQKSWSGAELTNSLNQMLRRVIETKTDKPFLSPEWPENGSVGTLKDLKVSRRGISGKAMALEITGSNGTWTVQKELVIRRVLQHGGKWLPSANIVFDLQKDPNGSVTRVTANGGGFGHGVGMSQLGASWMDGHGFRFPEIIQHYYKGVAIGSIPLNVGEGGSSLPIRHRFYVKNPTGTLYLQTHPANTNPITGLLGFSNTPITVLINDQPVKISLKQGEANIKQSLTQYLKAEQLNSIVLKPDPKDPKRPIKAWVELYPAK